ncbi:Panacea domain-containing protein [uncultured Limosilactobacillus sp.]|uniref:Panacea domain-containing protein n=1 Tax=uncultured Limosilactobacillus sp. TaxID=2837629 RepID=UPI00258A0B3A|nr:type II toxin-antitoxin system antitoxin SocA domain-containing protein [uncultured Limosilactobacillus sp.]
MDNEIDILNSFFSDNNQIDLQRPYRVMDVANYIVNRFSEQGHPITNLLLLKMLYYLQAYFLVNDNERLFTGEIQKWGYGPVEPIVYSYFKDNGASPIMHSVQYAINNNGKLEMINPEGRNLQRNDQLQIDRIIDRLYDRFHVNPFRLVEITHEEPMWLRDRDRIENGVHNIEYNNQEIIEYFNNGERWPWQ